MKLSVKKFLIVSCTLLAITQRLVLISYGRFGTTCRSHPQSSRTQTNSVLSYFADGGRLNSSNFLIIVKISFRMDLTEIECHGV